VPHKTEGTDYKSAPAKLQIRASNGDKIAFFGEKSLFSSA
jgi:hypothetical protein